MSFILTFFAFSNISDHVVDGVTSLINKIFIHKGSSKNIKKKGEEE